MADVIMKPVRGEQWLARCLPYRPSCICSAGSVLGEAGLRGWSACCTGFAGCVTPTEFQAWPVHLLHRPVAREHLGHGRLSWADVRLMIHNLNMTFATDLMLPYCCLMLPQS